MPVVNIVPEEKSPLKGPKRGHFFQKRDQKMTKNYKIFTKKEPPAGTETRQRRKMVIPNIFIFNMVLSRVEAPLKMTSTYFSKFIF